MCKRDLHYNDKENTHACGLHYLCFERWSVMGTLDDFLLMNVFVFLSFSRNKKQTLLLIGN